jgi:hypothetical protein
MSELDSILADTLHEQLFAQAASTISHSYSSLINSSEVI